MSREDRGRLVFRAAGLFCVDSARQLERAIAGLAGVRRARVNFGAARIDVWGDARPEAIERLGERLGFHLALDEPRADGRLPIAHPPRGRWQAPFFWLTLLGGLLLAAAAALEARPLPWLSLDADAWRRNLSMAGFGALGTFPALWAWNALSKRLLIRHALVVAAALGAALTDAWFEAALLLLIDAVGHRFVARRFDRLRRPLFAMAEAARPTEREIGEDCPVDVGERFPADGVLVHGETEVDEGALTGDEAPIAKGPGDRVFAGTVNLGEPVVVRATAPPLESVIQRAWSHVETVAGTSVPFEGDVARLGRAIATALAFAAVAVSALPPLLLGAPLRPWLLQGAVLLVLASPTALTLAAPAGYLGAVAAAAQNGIVVKDRGHFQRLREVDAVVFGMKGVLTRGPLSVTDVVPYGEMAPEEALAIAAAMTRERDDRWARAIAQAAERLQRAELRADAIHVESDAGASATFGSERYHLGSLRFLEAQGVHVGQVKSDVERLHADGELALVLARGLRVVGAIAFSNPVKEGGERSVRRLVNIGGVETTAVLTSEDAAVAASVAARLGIDRHVAGRSAKEKASAVERWQKEGWRVALVAADSTSGPAMEQAHVGVAMEAQASWRRLEAADVAVMGSDLSKIPCLIVLGRRALRAVHGNVALAAGIKVFALTLFWIGLLDLPLAALLEIVAVLLLAERAIRVSKPARVPSRRTRSRASGQQLQTV